MAQSKPQTRPAVLFIELDPAEKQAVAEAADFRGQTLRGFGLVAIRKELAAAKAEMAKQEQEAA